MHEPPNYTDKFEDRCEEQDPNNWGSFKCLYINDDNLNTRDGNEYHRKIEKSEEAFAFFCDWIFGMSAHVNQKL